MITERQLAQVNIGKILAPMDSPVMAEFKDNLDSVNRLAEESAGFVWRLKEENNNATSIQIFDDPFLLINMSVWESMDDLFRFVYQSVHVDYLKRRNEWFKKITDTHMALWWISKGHIPTCEEAIGRLRHIVKYGPSPFAFSFKAKFTSEKQKTG